MANLLNSAYTGINDLVSVNCDDMTASNINCDNFLNQSSSLFTGVSSNLQTQINTINSAIGGGSTGGGYFSVIAGQANGFVTANPYWSMGPGGVSSVACPVIHQFTFTVTSITFTCQTIPTTSATVYLYKNGINVYTMPGIATTSYTFNNINIIYLAGDSMALFTQSGSGGTLVRATVSCRVNGITGATPQLSIGTVSNLASGSTPTVTLTGTTLNPVLNFGLVQGIAGTNGTNGAQGPQGPKGDTGATGPQGPKGDTGDSSLQTQTNTAAIAGLVATCATLQTEIDGLGASILTIEGEITTIGTEISTINDEITSLQGKTQFITANQATNTTNVQGNFNVGSSINPSSFSINSSTGALTNTGDIKVNNSSGGSTIVLSGNTGNITGNQISCSTGNIDTITTSATQTQNINGSTVNIGTTGINTVSIGSSTSAVYINGLIYLPFSSSTSYFNQF